MEAGFAFIYSITHSTRPVVFTSLKKLNKLVTGGNCNQLRPFCGTKVCAYRCPLPLFFFRK